MLPRKAEDALFFVSIADAGSLARASRSLGMAPSTLSRRLSALEGRLGVMLVERTTRMFHLTDVGAAYLERARAMATALSDAEDVATSYGATPRGTLRVAGPPTVGAFVLGEAVARYTERCPEVRVDVVLGERAVDLRSERFDVALRLGLPATDPSDIVRRIGVSPRVVCADRGYLARHRKPTKVEDLADHVLIGLESTQGRHSWSFRRGSKNVVVESPSKLRVNSALLSLEACRAGAGLALLPQCLVRHELKAGSLIQVRLDLAPVPADVHLLLAAPAARTAKVRHFVEVLDQLPQDVLRWIPLRRRAMVPPTPAAPPADR
jgi:DNA-binding transcriptional LysR family regulator